MKIKKTIKKIRYLDSATPPERRTVESIFDDDSIGSAAGVRVTKKSMLQYAAIWRAVNLISASIAKLPLYVLRRVETEAGEGKTRAKEHPAYRLLLRKPTIDMTAYPFKQAIQSNVLTYGNGYAAIKRDGAANPIELIWLDPSQTSPVRENGGQLWYTTTINNEQRKIKEEDILHIKGFGYDGMIGYSAIEYGASTFGNGIAMQQYGTRFFKNSAIPGVVLECPRTLGPDATKNLLRGWKQMTQGVGNSHKTIVLEEDIKVNQLTMTAKDAQLIESRKFNIGEIATWFGVPAHKLGDPSKVSYNSLEQENLAWLTDTLSPFLTAWQEECWEKLLSTLEQDTDSTVIEFNVESLLKGDIKTTHEVYSKGIASGYLNVNEVRAMQNRNPIEGGDVFYKPVNVAPIDEEPEPGEPVTDPDPVVDPDEDDERNEKLIALAEKVYLEASTRISKRFEKQLERASDKDSKREQIKKDSAEYVRDSLGPAIEILKEAGQDTDLEKRYWETFDHGA